MYQSMNHLFSQPISHIPLPEKFTCPFHYMPHPLCVLAAEEVKAYIKGRKEWEDELSEGKMFGVLVVQDNKGTVSYLAAFSGNLAGRNIHPFFVPPIYDLLQPQGFFKMEEERITAINKQIKALETDAVFLQLKAKLSSETQQAANVLALAKADLKAGREKRELRRQFALSEEEQAQLIRESQYQKASFKRLEREWKKAIENRQTEIAAFEREIERRKVERKERSAALQQKLFKQFRILNANGEVKDLCTIFEETSHRIPPGGAGECALPKLLQYAYLHRFKPLAMAEFWWGNSPKAEVRHHGYYYPSCKGKCEPILKHMLKGLQVDENPLTAYAKKRSVELETVFEDEWLLVVNKPSGMLSVPGKDEWADSVYRQMRTRYPNATGPMIVHRLDMATSGLLLIAKTKEVHQGLQAQFENQSIKKRYVALLDGERLVRPLPQEGSITLPICPDPLDRPRQMVCETYGKTAVTHYQVLSQTGNQIRILFSPLTGRTHQLRVHAAHPQGLGCPIVGDELYGKKDVRLYLHAEYIEFRHPVYGEVICLQKEADF